MKKLIALSFCTILLTACGTPRDFDVGAKPHNAEKRAVEYVKKRLKDPDSMKDVETSPVYKASCFMSIYGNFRGWSVPIKYNAKNGFGGYVGNTSATVWFQNDMIKGISAHPQNCPEAQLWR